MKEIEVHNRRLDNCEWDEGHYVVISCDDAEEAKKLAKIIRELGLLSQEINNEN